MNPLVHREFAGYHLQRRLGGGGMGEVYLAETSDRRTVALKLIQVHDDDDSRDIVAAERLGAQLQKQFGARDPHVPAVYAAGEAEGYFFIEMEYVDGHDLAELIPTHIEPWHAASIAAEIAAFLEQAHGFRAEVGGREFKALVHADLKPKNIRINSRQEVKILDFGISKGLSLTGRLTTAAFGSRSYMSPEWLETGRLDRHVDLWALGVVLYEMLAGHPPYQAGNARQLELALKAGTPPLPLPATCPAPLARIVLKALASSLATRYSTASDFKADLDASRAGRPSRADDEWSAARSGEATVRTNASKPSADEPEATRRTDRATSAIGAEATKRTNGTDAAGTATVDPAPAGLPGIPERSGGSAAAAAVEVPPRRKRVRRWAGLAILGLTFMMTVNEYVACGMASRLRADLPTREDGDLDEAWSKYQLIDAQSGLGIARRRVSGAMADALVTHADRVIADFRQERPTVRERQWQQARTWLANASRLEPGNGIVLSRLRYCEGQLSRIDGEARLRGGQRDDADRLLHDALTRFEESAKLDRTWPDPWLGLLRTYVVGLEDLDKAVSALNEAERRGYRAGRRELTMLGEAYAAHAERTTRECDRRPDEGMCSCVRRSGELFEQAVSWFDRVEGSPEISRALVRAHAGLGTANARLAELDCQ